MSRLSGGLITLVRWIRDHGHHVVFAVTLVSLFALAGWWSTFLRNAVLQERYLKYESVRTSGTLHSFLIGHNPAAPPQLGPVGTDPRLEITTVPRYDQSLSWPLGPYWPNLFIQPLAEIVAGYEEESRSRTVMVIGESTLLGFLLLVSCVMLYRLIWTERRSAREVREFWSRVTHEIKTPIAGLKAFLQTLRSQDMNRAEMVTYVDMALRQVGRQQQLAENLLVGQRFGRGHQRLNTTRIDLGEFLPRFLEEQAFILMGRTLRLAPVSPVSVEADPDALRVIVGNLTDNAAKYGGENMELDVEVRAARSKVVISFSDNGPGFDPSRARVLFEAYRRLTQELPAGSHGTGMGLYISRRLARRMGGDLKAASAGLGQGARFLLTLRRWKDGSNP